jgi:hypothetical protein
MWVLAIMEHDDGYTAKVLAEYNRLQMVATGRSVPLSEPRETASPSGPMAVSLPVAATPQPAATPVITPVQPEALRENKATPEKVASLSNS